MVKAALRQYSHRRNMMLYAPSFRIRASEVVNRARGGEHALHTNRDPPGRRPRFTTLITTVGPRETRMVRLRMTHGGVQLLPMYMYPVAVRGAAGAEGWNRRLWVGGSGCTHYSST